ncbi:tRNA pseudouridine(55) synthase TruB [Desulfolucanica intricata]|uniref:tRNA pseudouridine(55) synthase TruB n=1 Tax=Desulfolucanica intricata TaxID=1285191 RepID=UPI000830E93F|nr:tRNA pseudouridine(55) synthase TruB [Desulfolucanica intricata]
MNGVINVLKPPGMTSHDVVNYIRRLTGVKKVGHTGTLDPGAAGVLPICVGKATRIAENLTVDNKSYRAEITFGVATDTHDNFGNVLSVCDASYLTENKVLKVIKDFTGKQEQVPPMTSAIKVKGKKLYELARAGQVIERKARYIIIYFINILYSEGWGSPRPRALLEIVCSKGTYIRTICHDLGQKLGCGAHMSFLLRTCSGDFKLDQSFTLEELKEYAEQDALKKVLLPIDQVLGKLHPVQIRDSAVASVKSGNKLYPPGVIEMPEHLENNQIVRLRAGNNLLALAKVILEQDAGVTRYIFQPFKLLV